MTDRNKPGKRRMRGMKYTAGLPGFYSFRLAFKNMPKRRKT